MPMFLTTSAFERLFWHAQLYYDHSRGLWLGSQYLGTKTDIVRVRLKFLVETVPLDRIGVGPHNLISVNNFIRAYGRLKWQKINRVVETTNFQSNPS